MKALVAFSNIRFFQCITDYEDYEKPIIKEFHWSKIKGRFIIHKGSFVLQEAVARRCSVKKVFLETSQNLQENNCATFSFLIKLQV